MKSFITISPELTLRVLRPSDAGALFTLVDANREHLRRWLPWVDGTREPADTQRFLQGRYDAFTEGLAVDFGIRHEDRLAGIIGFHGFDRINRVTSLGYWLAREFCGYGIMRQCAGACIEYAIREQDMNRIYIRCATGNFASKRIPQALAFAYEGVQRQAEWLYDHFVDLEVYSILAEEWTGLPRWRPGA